MAVVPSIVDRRHHRQRNGEGGAAPWPIALGSNGAAMQLDQVFHDGEPQAESPCLRAAELSA